MNREKLSELLSVAIDRKANIRIHFGQFHTESDYKPVTKEEAITLAKQFQEALNAPSIKEEFGGAGTKHLDINHDNFGICISYLPGESDIEEAKRRRIDALEKELAVLKNEEALA